MSEREIEKEKGIERRQRAELRDYESRGGGGVWTAMKVSKRGKRLTENTAGNQAEMKKVRRDSQNHY